MYLPYISYRRLGPCGMVERAAEAATLIVDSPLQQRDTFVCDARLVTAARWRCEHMVEHDYFDHMTPDGRGPNLFALAAGYNLPDWYRVNGNNIESIAAGQPSAEEVVKAWAGSELGHGVHLWGQIDFFRNQTAYGLWYIDARREVIGVSKRFTHYWCFLSAPQ